jgi:hypothetical protein
MHLCGCDILPNLLTISAKSSRHYLWKWAIQIGGEFLLPEFLLRPVNAGLPCSNLVFGLMPLIWVQSH